MDRFRVITRAFMKNATQAQIENVITELLRTCSVMKEINDRAMIEAETYKKTVELYELDLKVK